MGSKGTTPASGWARAGAGSWAIQLPHFQFKVMLKKRKWQGSGLGPGTYSPWSSTEEQLRRAGRHIPCQLFSGDRVKSADGRQRNGEVRNLDGRLSQREGTELHAGTAKGFLDELMSKDNKKKGCFSTLPRNPGCPTERIFWATLSQCPRDA
ncbi:hypothetical protein CIB84_012886, partial [Bambusicola thoracicus]